ncbi:hypothetical protein ACJ2A9_06110 [Anaerobacillus sp. MEB173]|uniref:hypothetical protein n=1 Tax=Anaerobacillus sp. MEB173 TaxID=3383345 RepID=UPI003F8FC413
MKTIIIKYGLAFAVYITLMIIYEYYFYTGSPWIPAVIFLISMLVLILLERVFKKKE